MAYPNIEIGKVYKVADIEWIVLDAVDDVVLCLTKDFVYTNTQFDHSTNNYAKSEIHRRLNGEFLDRITNRIEADALLDVEIDLTSDDGLDDYGKVADKVGLLTVDIYRKYNRIIEKYPVNSWWWLATPFSTPHRGYSSSVRCVCGVGTLSSSSCYDDYFGVRPLCIFKSYIF